MFTTLFEDDTHTFFDSGLPTISRLPRVKLVGYLLVATRRERLTGTGSLSGTGSLTGRENFSDGITTSGLTVGGGNAAGFIELLPTGTAASYRFQNNTGTLDLSQNSASLLSISSTGDLTLAPLKKTLSSEDTTELVPILVDQNGKLYRGHSLFQTISQLTQRIQALEAAGSVQVESRVSTVEQLVSRLRQRYNDLNLSSSAI